MRTSVEITAGHHEALVALAAKRGIRGYSPLVREALDLYLAEHAGGGLDAVLDLEGSLTESQAREAERLIAEAWTTWPTAS